MVSLNELLFLNKSCLTEIRELGSTAVTYTATRTIRIYSLPSTVEDSTNTVLSTITASSKITTLTSTTLSNTNGDLFYITKVGDSYGFVRSNFLQSTRGTVELTTPCNAKTKRETILYEDASGTASIITLNKGTRIALLEDPAPNKTHLKAEYQDPNGIIYTGYVYSEDIKQDGLSTLQILGLILIVANITVLTLIIIIKKRSQKWKVKQQPGDTNKPHHLDLT